MTLYDYPDAPYLNEALIDECDRLFVKAEEAAESDAVLQRIKREHLSIKYIKAVRIADSEERCRATDEFAAEVRAFRLTEIMERLPLDDSFEYMKKTRYAKDRTGKRRLYYIVR